MFLANSAPACRQVDAVMWRFPDRSTSIGAAINAYLSNQSQLDDAVIHMLFVANRLEKRCVAWSAAHPFIRAHDAMYEPKPVCIQMCATV